MIILGIETATSVCGAAIASGGRLLAERSVTEAYVHSERLMSFIEEALAAARTTVDACDAIAVSAGPGSFTGLRIGLSVAKGLAYACGKPLVVVPTLTALAQRAIREWTGVNGRDILAALDARREEVYCQLFSADGHPLSEPRDLTIDQLGALVGDRMVILTGDAVAKIRGAFPEHVEAAPQHLTECSAASVAILGGELAAAGNTSDPAGVEPLYIKEFFFRTRQAQPRG